MCKKTYTRIIFQLIFSVWQVRGLDEEHITRCAEEKLKWHGVLNDTSLRTLVCSGEQANVFCLRQSIAGTSNLLNHLEISKLHTIDLVSFTAETFDFEFLEVLSKASRRPKYVLALENVDAIIAGKMKDFGYVPEPGLPRP